MPESQPSTVLPSPPAENDQPPNLHNHAQISAEQKRKIGEWFSKTIVPNHPKCQMCGSDNWILLDDLVTPSPYDPGRGPTMAGFAYPHFMLACNNCGAVVFINAIATGVVEKDKK